MIEEKVNEFFREFQEFDETCFPADFLQKYEPIECFGNNQNTETLLVKERHTGTVFVAKSYYKQTLFSNKTESELLKVLHHDGLPAFRGEYQNDIMLCVVREYVEGLTLNQFVQEGPITEAQLISFGVQLCDILSYLHGHTPPIIHRDIKPQNIIIDKKGRIKLIDFGISRVYDQEAKADTVFMGTQEFSPPEQYGFSQTDCRSDIFSLGVVLCWLLTGETRWETAAAKIQNRQLARLIRGCTAFAPKDRYADTATVKKALLKAHPAVQKRKWILSVIAGVLVVALSFAGGFWWHSYHSRKIFTADHLPAYITSPALVGEAVRYLNEKYTTELFVANDESANMGYLRKLLKEVFGYDEKYVYAMPPQDPPYPHESKSNFFPWGLPETESIPKEIITYTAVKIFWPEVVTDYSSLKDDNGVYPGVRVAMTFAEKHHLLSGINRPAHLTYGDVAVILANAVRESEARK